MSVERYQFIAAGQGDVVAAFKSIGRAANDSKATVEKSFEGVPRAAARSAGRVEAVDSRAQARRIAILERAESARKARIDRAADAEIRALEKKLAREAALEEKAAAKRLALAERAAKKEASAVEQRRAARQRAIGRLGDAAISGAAAIGLGAAGLVGLAVRGSMQLEDKARRVAIQGSTGEKRQDVGEMRRFFENTALAVPGATAMGVATGAERFMAKTGDAEAVKRFGRVWAEVGIATSANIEDIADASADLMQKFDIRKTEDMERALAALAVQGKRGAFELKDAAAQYPKIAAAAQRFGIGKGVGALVTLGGLTQLARSATGSAEEAGTSVERMFSNLTEHAAKIKARHGIDVYQGDIRDTLVNVVAKVGGNDMPKKRAELEQLFGERGIRAISPLLTAFADALKDGKDGVRAMRDRLAEATDAEGALSEVQRDLVDAQESSSARLTAAWESVKARVGDATPAIADLAKQFADFVTETDFSFLADALTGLADAASSAAEFLESLGVLKKKPKTIDDDIKAAERAARLHGPEYERLMKKYQEEPAGKFSVEEGRRLQELMAERRRPDVLRDEKAHRENALKQMAEGYMSEGELAGALTGADTGKTLFGHKTQLTAAGAKDVAHKLYENPDTPLRDLGLEYGEDSPQLALIRKFAGTVHTARGEGSGITPTERARAADTLNRGSAAADASAKEQAAAAKEQQQAAKALKDAAEALKKAGAAHFAGADAHG